MAIAKVRKVAAVCGDGRIRLVQQDVPPLRPGAVLVEVHASLVSPGTELGGWRGLAAKRKSPDPDAKPRPFGYSNAGTVLEAGEGVDEFKSGDRVACIGMGYALHSNLAVVPHNLCVALPPDATFAQGSYAMLSATALQAVRRGRPQLGESVAVVGLGLVGQLTARLHQLAGGFVIGWDVIPQRTELAGKWGIDATATPGAEDEVQATMRFTNGYGVDGAVLAFGGRGDSAVQSLERCMKISPDGHRMGRIVVVGGTRFDYTGSLTNIDIRRASRTGPGYHDEDWEVGPAYPRVFMRWTTRTNLELCMRLIADRRLDVDVLTTHTIPLADVEEGIEAAIARPDEMLGVVFTM